MVVTCKKFYDTEGFPPPHGSRRIEKSDLLYKLSPTIESVQPSFFLH
jgi:hypothetical protein